MTFRLHIESVWYRHVFEAGGKSFLEARPFTQLAQAVLRTKALPGPPGAGSHIGSFLWSSWNLKKKNQFYQVSGLTASSVRSCSPGVLGGQGPKPETWSDNLPWELGLELFFTCVDLNLWETDWGEVDLKKLDLDQRCWSTTLGPWHSRTSFTVVKTTPSLMPCSC